MALDSVTRYAASTFDGTHMTSRGELTPKVHSLNAPGVAVFELDHEHVPPNTYCPLPARVAPGQRVHIVGLTGTHKPQLTSAEGFVSHYDPFVDPLISCIAYADDVFPGGPVFDIHGFLVGIVHGCEDTKKNIRRVLPALDIHQFLRSKGMPGLSPLS